MDIYWEKKLSDGTTELGTQSMIDEGKASWTKGRHDIFSVEMTFAGKKLIISAPYKRVATKWKQFDRWSVSPGQKPVMVGRALICSSVEYSYVKILRTESGVVCNFSNSEGDPIPPQNELVCYITAEGDIVLRTRGIKE